MISFRSNNLYIFYIYSYFYIIYSYFYITYSYYLRIVINKYSSLINTDTC